MYIPEFWCGVGATLLVELGLVIIAVVIATLTKEK